MKIKSLMISVLCLFSISVFSQETVLQFKTKAVESTYHKNEAQRVVKNDFKDAILEIIVLQDESAISYKTEFDDNSVLIKDENPRVFKKGKDAYKGIKLENDLNKEPSFTLASKFKWTPLDTQYIKSDKKPKEKKALATKPDISVEYTGKEIEHNGFKCKEAIIRSENKDFPQYNYTTTVYYTEQFDYSWCFADEYRLLPGTVILAKSGDKVFFELLTRSDNVREGEGMAFSKKQMKEMIDL